ncbi:MAG: glycosyltransferase family 39 protein [Bacteroidota bacterium]
MKRSRIFIFFLLIIVVSTFMHFKQFPKELISFHSWRQTYTQSTIQNFYEEDMNILNPRINDRGNGDGIFRMEFPLMQWLIACLYKVFGPHLILSRIFVFIIGLFSLFGIFRLMKTLFKNEIIGMIAAWALCFSPSFFYYTVNPMPDNLALCFSIWAVLLFFQWHQSKKTKLLIAAGILFSLTALCKLPFILYYSIPAAYLIILLIRKKNVKKLLIPFLFFFSFIIFPAIWYINAIPHWHGNGITAGMADNTLPFSTLLDFWRHTLISTLPELLLNYGSVIFFIAGIIYIFRNKKQNNQLFPVFLIWGISALAYYFFEANMIARVHDYYLFPFLPILFIIVSFGAYQMYSSGKKGLKYLTLFLLLILPLFTYLRMIDRWKPDSPGFNKDLLIYKEELRNAVPDNALCIVGNDVSHSIFFYYIHKKGWVFYDNWIIGSEIKDMVTKGAKYLYSDSRSIENCLNNMAMLDSMIIEKGSIRVFRLK